MLVVGSQKRPLASMNNPALRDPPATASVRRRLLVLMMAGNLAGAMLTFAYFHFLDTAAHEGLAAPGPLQLAYFVVAFGLLSLAGRWIGVRWMAPLAAWAAGDRREPLPASLRRRVLLVPGYFALLTLAGWLAAALIWGVAWPALSGQFEAGRSVRQMFGIVFVAGMFVTLFVFLAVERIWRPQLVRYFPAGDLSAAGAPRLAVRTRLVVVSLVTSILPIIVLSVAARTRANALLGADAELSEAIIRNLLMVEAVLALAFTMAAIRLARIVAASVSEPLRDLQSAMTEVGRGRFDVRCAVVSNDEIGAVSEGFNRMVDGLREREVIRETFGRYVSPEVRDEILAGRASSGGNLHGDLREVTILFADLRDFTPWVESRPAAEVVAGLNEYFTEMDAAIRAQGGLVLQFIGDEIEAVFGAPVADEHHADHALAAARDMQSRLEAWNAGRRAAGLTELHHGIGIHSGTVLAGNIGSSERMAYALVGDAVNVASRIQSLNKDLGTQVLVSAETQRRLSDAAGLVALPAARVKGRKAEVAVYSVAA
jgi:adenylate cyclase